MLWFARWAGFSHSCLTHSLRFTLLYLSGNTGNTPLHLAMESAHAEAAALLVEAGADRSRVSISSLSLELYLIVHAFVLFTRTFSRNCSRFLRCTMRRRTWTSKPRKRSTVWEGRSRSGPGTISSVDAVNLDCLFRRSPLAWHFVRFLLDLRGRPRRDVEGVEEMELRVCKMLFTIRI